MVTSWQKDHRGKFTYKFISSTSKIFEISHDWLLPRFLYNTRCVYRIYMPFSIQCRGWHSCCHPNHLWMLYCTCLYLCSSVRVSVMLQLTKSFAFRHACGTGGWAGMPWDIYLFIEALAPLASYVGDCLPPLLMNLCIFAGFHSWPRWPF